MEPKYSKSNIQLYRNCSMIGEYGKAIGLLKVLRIIMQTFLDEGEFCVRFETT